MNWSCLIYCNFSAKLLYCQQEKKKCLKIRSSSMPTGNLVSSTGELPLKASRVWPHKKVEINDSIMLMPDKALLFPTERGVVFRMLNQSSWTTTALWHAFNFKLNKHRCPVWVNAHVLHFKLEVKLQRQNSAKNF